MLILGQADSKYLQEDLLQLTGYRVYRPGAGYTALTVQCFTQTRYRVYLPSPFLGKVDGKLLPEIASTDRLQSLRTGCWLHRSCGTVLHLSWLQSLPAQSIHLCCFWGSYTVSICKILLQPTGYKVYQPDAGYTALIVQAASPKLVTEPTDLVHSTLNKKSRQQVAPTDPTDPTDLKLASQLKLLSGVFDLAHTGQLLSELIGYRETGVYREMPVYRAGRR